MQAPMVWAISLSLAATQEMVLANARLFYFPPGTEMFHFPGYANLDQVQKYLINQMGSPIRRSPDQRLLGTSPKLIATMLRPSSLIEAKASTICS